VIAKVQRQDQEKYGIAIPVCAFIFRGHNQASYSHQTSYTLNGDHLISLSVV